jgi:hypothetical protein
MTRLFVVQSVPNEAIFSTDLCMATKTRHGTGAQDQKSEAAGLAKRGRAGVMKTRPEALKGQDQDWGKGAIYIHKQHHRESK